MTTDAQTLAPKKHSLAATASMVVVFWGVAALLVIAAHQTLGHTTPAECVALKLASIILVAFAYMKLAAPDATLDHSLAVGVVWLLLAIVVEVATSERSGHGWFDLIGSPDSALRNVLLIAWIIAPSLFARQVS